MKIPALLLLPVALAVAAPFANANTCYYQPDVAPYPTEEPYFLVCSDSLIANIWSTFDFDEEDWDDGMGFNDRCNLEQPLARTYNALTLLAWAHTGEPHCDTSQPNVMDWAYCWAGNAIDELDAKCGSGEAYSGDYAYTRFGPIINNYTELYWPFFYGETVVERASTIFHEARHAGDWCQHADNSSCANGASCDTNWATGCTGWGASAGAGANTFQVVWLMQYATSATWYTYTQHFAAVIKANDILARRYQTDPCFRLGWDGWPYQVC
jgi:hypothetical protein